MSDARPPVGELPPFARRTLGLFTRRRFPYDRLVPVRPFSSRYLLTRPEDVRHVLMEDGRYRKTPEITSDRGRERVREGLLSRSGREHRERRRLLQRLFHRRAVRSHGTTVRDVVDEWIGRRTDGERLDLAEEMARLTRDVILRILFGAELGEATRRDVSGAIATRRRYTEHLYHGRLPFRDRLPTPLARAHRRAVETLDEAVYGAIRRRRAGDAERDDLVSDLVSVTDREGRGLSDPDRSLVDGVLDGRPPRFVYLPFGDGPHRCLGEHLAVLEARAALTRIGRRLRFRPLDPGPVEPHGGVTLTPRGGLPVEVELR